MLLIFGLFIFFISIVAETSLFYDKTIWRHRHSYTISIAGLLGLSLAILTPQLPVAIALLIWLTTIYRFVNLGRVYLDRLPSKHLHSISVRSFAVISSLQSLLIFIFICNIFLGLDITLENLIGFALISSAFATVCLPIFLVDHNVRLN